MGNPGQNRGARAKKVVDMIDRGTKRWLGEGLWVIAGQALSAVGTLAGLRLLTDLLPPAVLENSAGLLGVVARTATGLANPTTQAMLPYPERALQGK